MKKIREINEISFHIQIRQREIKFWNFHIYGTSKFNIHTRNLKKQNVLRNVIHRENLYTCLPEKV